MAKAKSRAIAKPAQLARTVTELDEATRTRLVRTLATLAAARGLPKAVERLAEARRHTLCELRDDYLKARLEGASGENVAPDCLLELERAARKDRLPFGSAGNLVLARLSEAALELRTQAQDAGACVADWHACELLNALVRSDQLLAAERARDQEFGDFAREVSENVGATSAVLYMLAQAGTPLDAGQRTVRAVLSTFTWDAGMYFTVNADQQTLTLAAASGELADDMLRMTRFARPSREQSVFAAAWQRADVVVSALQANTHDTLERDLLSKGVHTVIAVPVSSGERVVALLAFLVRSETVLSESRKDVLRSVASTLSSTMERLDDRDAFAASLRDFAAELMEVSRSLRGTTAEQSASAQELASAIGQVTATLSELRETSLEALRNAESVIGKAEGAFQTSASGRESVGRAIDSMRGIREQVSEIAERILQLNDQTSQIGSIISTVNEISAQSKLLALNAAIEAARAGEHGKGFGVVASEIRSLAEQSKEATSQVRAILGEIQTCTNAAVVAAEEGTKKSESGMALADQSGAKIQELARSMEESSSSARLIANSARQQSAGIEQVAQALVSISNATNSTASGLKHTEQATAQLVMLAERMVTIVRESGPASLSIPPGGPENQNAAE
jgi:methyl-accepting chemotaxis protein